MTTSKSQYDSGSPNYKLVPANVTFCSEDDKLTKVPTIAKITHLDRSEYIPECKHYKYFVDAKSGLFVIDVDREDSSQPYKKDGINFFEKWCGPIEANDTLTIRTIDKGYYKVYRRTPEIEGIMKSGPIHPLYLCNILSAENDGFIFGDGYNIIKRMLPQNPPKSIINFICNNIYDKTQNILGRNVSECIKSVSPISQLINNIIGAHEIVWDIEEGSERGPFILIPQTTECCVVTGYYHTGEKQSCLYVYKSSVVCYCHSHGKRVLTGSLSRSIRNIFFDIECHRIKSTNLLHQKDDIEPRYCKNVMYFAVSRDVVNKDKMYGKFGNYKFGCEKRRFSSYNTVNPSFDYATVPYNQKAFREFIGYSHEYLDNYINHKIFLKKSNKPLVNFKNTDWFEILENAAKDIISYIKKLDKRPIHACNLTQLSKNAGYSYTKCNLTHSDTLCPSEVCEISESQVCKICVAEECIPLNNKYDFQLFLETICDYLDVVPAQRINSLLFLGAAS